jgi:hypothetical protein
MILNKHFREFIELLEKHRVEYLVVGGYAVGFHGFPRYTGRIVWKFTPSEAFTRRIRRKTSAQSSLPAPQTLRGRWRYSRNTLMA